MATPLGCRTCGRVYQARSLHDPCPWCAPADVTITQGDAVSLTAPTTDDPLTNTLVPRGDAPPPDNLEPDRDLAEFIATRPTIPSMPPVKAPSDEIDCPRCAERIKARARECRFCGANVEDELDRREEEKRGRRSRGARSSGRIRYVEDPSRMSRVAYEAQRMRDRDRGRRDAAEAQGFIFFTLAVVFGAIGFVALPLLFGILACVFGLISVMTEGPKGWLGLGFGVANLIWVAFVVSEAQPRGESRSRKAPKRDRS